MGTKLSAIIFRLSVAIFCILIFLMIILAFFTYLKTFASSNYLQFGRQTDCLEINGAFTSKDTYLTFATYDKDLLVSNDDY